MINKLFSISHYSMKRLSKLLSNSIVLSLLSVIINSLRLPNLAPLPGSTGNNFICTSQTIQFSTMNATQVNLHDISLTPIFISSYNSLSSNIGSLFCGKNDIAIICLTPPTPPANCFILTSNPNLKISTCYRTNGKFYNNDQQFISLTTTIGQIYHLYLSNNSANYINRTDAYLDLAASGDGTMMIALNINCVLEKFVKSAGLWTFSIGANLQQSCSGKTQIIFNNNAQFLIITNSGTLSYERRSSNDLSLISSWSQPILQFHGNTIIPDQTRPQIWFLAKQGPGGAIFVAEFDYELNQYLDFSILGFPMSVIDFGINQVGFSTTNGSLWVFHQISFCPTDNQFFNGATCATCLTDCLFCINNTSCLKCNGTMIFNLTSISCQIPSSLANCPQGYYSNTNNQCIPCNQFCRTCTSNSCLIPKYYAQFNQNGQLEQTLWIKIIVYLASIPNIRITFDKPALFYLTADRIWLYQYQKHNHHRTLINTFETINYIENRKFIPFYIDQYFEKISFTPYLQLDYYQNFGHSKFKLIEKNNGTMVEALQNFLIFSLPSCILSFFIMHIVFKCLFRYRISIYLRTFSFLAFLMVSILEPNIEYISFLFANQMQMLIFQNIKMKFIMAISVIVFFHIMVFAIGAYMIIYYHYKKLAKYFVDDCFRIMASFCWYGLQIGIKAILLGFTHAFLYNYYFVQLLVLMSIEIIFILVRIYIWKKKSIFLFQSVTCLTILNGFSMVFFQFILIFEQLCTRLTGPLGIKQNELFQKIHLASLFCLLVTSILCSISRMLIPYFETLQIFAKKIQKYFGKNQQVVKTESKIDQNSDSVNISAKQPEKKIEQVKQYKENVNKILEKSFVYSHCNVATNKVNKKSQKRFIVKPIRNRDILKVISSKERQDNLLSMTIFDIRDS